MTETRTLHFDSARQLQSLYANDLQLLKRMEDSLGVKVTTREGWVKLEGERERIEKAERVFNQLDEAQKKGVSIQKHEFQYALNSVNESRGDDLTDAVSMKITTSPRKAPIVARSSGQRNYVEAIDKHDIVFFFFSSRRRHTRSDRDWSSDVCSSDLVVEAEVDLVELDVHAGDPELLLQQPRVLAADGARRREQQPEGERSTALVADAVEIGRASCRERV